MYSNKSDWIASYDNLCELDDAGKCNFSRFSIIIMKMIEKSKLVVQLEFSC